MQHFSNDERKNLLAWCRLVTEKYPQVDIVNFTTSWADGLAFNAILHNHSPDLFDFDKIIQKGAGYRLRHAFELIEEYFDIPKILDSDDVCSNRADSNALMSYVMQLYNRLTRSDDNSSDYDSRNMDGDDDFIDHIREYKLDLEDALASILEVEEHLCDSDLTDKELNDVKLLFDEHQVLLDNLQKCKEQVKYVLQEGKALIETDIITEEEKNEIEIQRSLLKNRLEQLSLKAAELSSILDDKLMSLQQKQINSLKTWLRGAEDRLSLFPDVTCDLPSLKEQLKELKTLQEDIVRQEKEVVHPISSLVWIVDDTDAQAISSDWPEELQDQLAPLEEKWRNVRVFIGEQKAELEEICSDWEKLEKKEREISDRMNKLERRLFSMEEGACESHIGSDFIDNLIVRSHQIDERLKEEYPHCEEFADAGHKLGEKLGDTPLGKTIGEKLNSMAKRWDEIVFRLKKLNEILTKLKEESTKDETPSASPERFHRTSSQSSSSSSIRTREERKSRIPVPSSSSKKPKLDNFHAISKQLEDWKKCLEEFVEWLSSLEEIWLNSEDSTTLQTLSWLSDENQDYILKNPENDPNARRDQFNQLITQGKKFIKDLSKYDADTSNLAETIDVIDHRWCKVLEAYDQRLSKLEQINELKEIYKKTESLSEVPKNVHTFLQNQPETLRDDFLESLNDNCYERLKALHKHEEKLDHLKKKLENIFTKEPTLLNHPIMSKIEEFFGLWNEVEKRLQDMVFKTEEALAAKKVKAKSKADVEQLLAGINTLQSWLKLVQSERLSTDLYLAVNTAEIGRYVQGLRDLEKDFRCEEENLKYLKGTTEEVMQSALKTPLVKQLNSRINSLEELWDECKKVLEYRLEKMEEVKVRLKSIEVDKVRLDEWLSQLNNFVEEKLAYGDLQALENQIEECNIVLREIESSIDLEDIVKNTDSLTEILEPDAEIRRYLSDSIRNLSEKWKTIRNKVNTKRNNLENTLNRAKSAYDSLEKLDRDSSSLAFEVDELNQSLVEDYQTTCDAGQSLHQKLRNALKDTQNLHAAILNLSPSSDTVTQALEDMKAKADNLHQVYSDLDDSVDRYLSSLKQCYSTYGEFNRLLKIEKEWLDRLEQKLKQSPNLAVDAEEISGSLEDLETYLRHRPTDNREKINRLAIELKDKGFMVDKVDSELSALSQRAEYLQHQAEKRLVDLEGSINDAQQCEQEVLGVAKWFSEIDQRLEKLLVNDNLAEDMSKEVERLEKEFVQNKALLTRLNNSIENYRSQERLEAAHRLSKQLKILSTQMKGLEDKFKKVKSPSDFETKINIISKNLHQLMTNLQELKVTSHESHVIQDELRECRKMIKEIQSFKREMEKVSSQGKLALETSEDPSMLRKKLDKIRDLFGGLLEQALQRREELENLLSISETISTDMFALKSWLNLQEEPASVEKSEFELWKRKLEELTDKVQSFHAIFSGQSLSILTENLSTVQSDFKLLQRMMSTPSNFDHDYSSDPQRTRSLPPPDRVKSSSEAIRKLSTPGLQEIPKSTSSSLRSSQSVKTSSSQQSIPSDSVHLLDFYSVEEIKSLIMDLEKIKAILMSREILVANVKNFDEQKNNLKKVKLALDSARVKVSKMNIHKDLVSKVHPHGELIDSLISRATKDYNKVKDMFFNHSRRIKKSKRDAKKIIYLGKIVNDFLKMACNSFSESRLPSGELDIEAARQSFPTILDLFSKNVPHFNKLNAMVQQAPDGLVEYHVAHKNRQEQWKNVVRELAWRKERLNNEGQNLDILLYWNSLEQYLEKVDAIVDKLDKKVESFEEANILQNDIENLETKLFDQWLKIETISLAPTILIGKDVNTIEANFNKSLVKMSLGKLALDNYLITFKEFSKKLDDELQWVTTILESDNRLKGLNTPELNDHDEVYEELIVSFNEISQEGERLGHKLPSFLANKMDSLRLARNQLKSKIPYYSENPEDCYYWMDNQLNYMEKEFSQCQDKNTIDNLKHVLDNFSNITQKDPYYSWNALKEKASSLRIRLEANSGDQMNQLILCLRELIEWVIKRQTEMDSMPTIGGDVAILTHQQQEYDNFRLQLDERKAIIENALASARSCLPKDLPPLEESIYSSGMDESTKNVLSVQRETNKLSDKWFGLLQHFDQKQRKLDEVLRKMYNLQKQMDDLYSKLHQTEIVKSKWQPISDLILDRLPEQIEELQRFKEDVYPVQLLVEQVNECATRITGSNVLLSHTNLNRLEELNTRWKLIQVAIEQRRKGLEQAMIDHGSAQQQFLSSSVEHPWERVASNKVPYYINHATETTHWDHPKMTELMNSMLELNEIRFSAYRTAMKLRLVQRRLYLDYVHINSLVCVLDEFGLRAQNDKLINVPEMINCLQAIYERAAIEENAPSIDVPLCIDLCLNWLLNLYDLTTRTGLIRIFSFKIGLVVLCRGPLGEKYRYMFRLIADVRGLADERQLALLLHDLIQVPCLLGEISAFGGLNVDPSVRSCFERCGNRPEIEAVDFLSWLQQEPQSIVWLPVLHRLVAAENAKHQARCSVCKQFPIIGFRYRCLLCFSFDMCQMCFFYARTAKSHKITHPLHEYCLETDTGEDVKDFSKMMRNKFRISKRYKNRPKFGYLPVQSDGENIDSPSMSPSHPMYNDVDGKIDSYGNRLAEVEINGPREQYVDLDGSSEDEHQLIAQYCQSLKPEYIAAQIPPNPVEIITAIDSNQRNELETLLRKLEEENSLLREEYDRLRMERGSRIITNGSDTYEPMNRREYSSLDHRYSSNYSSTRSKDDSIMQKPDWRELENRRLFLENQNKQLESTLDRLRHQFSPSDLNHSNMSSSRLSSAGYNRSVPLSSYSSHQYNSSSLGPEYRSEFR